MIKFNKYKYINIYNLKCKYNFSQINIIIIFKYYTYNKY